MRQERSSGGAEIVERSRTALIFTKRGNTYGCLVRRGKAQYLARTQTGPNLSAPKLAGRFAGLVTATIAEFAGERTFRP